MTENVMILKVGMVDEVVIDQAARLCNMTLEEFIIKAAIKRSKKIIAQNLEEKNNVRG